MAPASSTIRRIAALAVALLVVAPASASALTATSARIAQHPGFVRLVVDFSGGTLQIADADATDVTPGDGTARVDVRGTAIGTPAIDRLAAGVRARVVQAKGRLVIRLRTARRAFKYLRVSGLHRPERLVIDLLGAEPPGRAAEIRAGRNGCLRLASVTADGRGFRVRGDGIFKIDHDDVGVTGERPGDHARVRSRRGQHAPFRAVDAHPPIPCAAGANAVSSGGVSPVASASATSMAVAGASLAPVRK